MNLSPNKIWTRVSTRRFVSLFVTVIWLATALQPCVMASFAESDSQDVGTHHSGHSAVEQNKDAHSACPHCKTIVGDKTPCDPQSDENCDGDDVLVYYERTKPVDAEKLYEEFKPIAPNNGRDIKIRTYSALVTTISDSLHPPSGPPIRDLYQVYLK